MEDGCPRCGSDEVSNLLTSELRDIDSSVEHREYHRGHRCDDCGNQFNLSKITDREFSGTGAKDDSEG